MNVPDRQAPDALPVPVLQILREFEEALGVAVRLLREPPDDGSALFVLHTSPGFPSRPGDDGLARRPVVTGHGRPLTLEVASAERAETSAAADVLAAALERGFELDREVRFFTWELSERYEEINLLYSISETLGSILRLDDAARVILREVCDVMGARRGSLWVHDPAEDVLNLTASVGNEGLRGPLQVEDPVALTSMVFREGTPVIASRTVPPSEGEEGEEGASFLSVPIRYSPPAGESRTVGVVNLIGRRHGDRFSAADTKLLSAIASQIGAALENHRLIEESLSKERMAREMELAHDLQMKLLPSAERFAGADAAARVSPAEQVGGDFYQLFQFPDGRVGVMLGDVSLHGFPSALIMTLTMSAAGIYAREHAAPGQVLRAMDDALSEELETTEMFLTMFYGVIDPRSGTLVYSNAGHPHAFVIRSDGGLERLGATDPPVGFAGPEAYGEATIEWAPEEDLLLLFTDGLSDTLSHGTRNDGEERVLDSVVKNRGCPPSQIVEDLFALTVGADSPITGDDRTALVLRL